ncbi:MAG TPA: glycosyltransferase family 4 protein [Methylocystis sp.]|nr:glycosyltransferase family 4 protein [Methylocystis sp.]
MALQSSSPSPRERRIAGHTVLQIIPDLESGGAERSAVDIAEALAKAGARCLVASRGGRLVGELQSKGGVWLPFPAATKNPIAMLLNSVRLARILRDENVEIVHARSRAPAWVAYYAVRQVRTRFVTTYHSAYSGTSPAKRHYNSIMAAGDVVIAASRFTARRIAELHPEATPRIATIGRGVDMRAFSPHEVTPERVERLRAKWGVDPHHRIVLLPARVTARKGHFVLLDAAKRLRAEGLDDLQFVFAGDARSDSYLKSIEHQINRLGLQGCVHIVGYCDDMPAAYLAAAATIAPATEPEAFGRVPVEAQAMGAPVIVSDFGAAPEVVLGPPEVPAAQATGWRTPPNDAEALAKAIVEALTLTASARESLGRRARDFIASRYSIESMCEATLDVYEALL